MSTKEAIAWRWRFEDQDVWRVQKSKPTHAHDRDVVCEPLFPRSATLRSANAEDTGVSRAELDSVQEMLRRMGETCTRPTAERDALSLQVLTLTNERDEARALGRCS